MVNEVLTKYTGLRKKLEYDYVNKRKIGKNNTMFTHGFRKFFHTECAKSGLYPDYIDLMLGHKLQGVRGSYLILDTQTLLEGTKETKGYVAAIDALTINEENRLSKKVLELEEKNQNAEYIIKGKLKSITQENQSLKSLGKLNVSNERRGEIIASIEESLYEVKEQLKKMEKQRQSLNKKMQQEQK
jgi:hypothetical protein